MKRNILRSVLLVLATFSNTDGWSQTTTNTPSLKADLTVNQPVFVEGGTTNLMILFALKNNGKEVVDPKIESSKLVVNGKELKESRLIFMNGPRDTRWKALPPGGTIKFGYAMGEFFTTPGTHKVAWKSDSFEAREIEFKVDPKKPGIEFKVSPQNPGVELKIEPKKD